MVKVDLSGAMSFIGSAGLDYALAAGAHVPGRAAAERRGDKRERGEQADDTQYEFF